MNLLGQQATRSKTLSHCISQLLLLTDIASTRFITLQFGEAGGLGLKMLECWFDLFVPGLGASNAVCGLDEKPVAADANVSVCIAGLWMSVGAALAPLVH